MRREYEPSLYVEGHQPTPLLMVVAVGDTSPDRPRPGGYQRALEPKRLVLLPGGHFDAYVKDFDAASPVRPPYDWFFEHLALR